MYKYCNILVGLDISEKDDEVLRYTAFLLKHIKCEKMFFMHVTYEHDLPKEIKDQYPELTKATDVEIRSTMKETVESILPRKNRPELFFYVREGYVVQNMLTTVKHDHIDLIIVGKKPHSEQGAQVAIKLTRKTPCSVLRVPMGNDPEITKVLVPIDFSDCSKLAVKRAITIAAETEPKLPLLFFHAYDVPSGYMKTGKSFDEFSEIMKNNASQRFEEFMEDVDLQNVPYEKEFVYSEEVDEAILDKAHTTRCDLIIVGARGRSASAAFLLGSLSESLIRTSRIPILAVKKKEEGMGLLDAILKL